MKKLFENIKNIALGSWRLLQGMWITLRNMFRRKVTRQYPENRGERQYSERFRAELTMPHDENNYHKCTACGICEMNCPNKTIQVLFTMEKDEETGRNRKVLDKYLYDIGSCIFCSLCTQSCPQDAITWSNDFEHSVFNKYKLNYKLNQDGSMLLPKPAKQPAPAPAAKQSEEAVKSTENK